MKKILLILFSIMVSSITCFCSSINYEFVFDKVDNIRFSVEIDDVNQINISSNTGIYFYDKENFRQLIKGRNITEDDFKELDLKDFQYIRYSNIWLGLKENGYISIVKNRSSSGYVVDNNDNTAEVTDKFKELKSSSGSGFFEPKFSLKESCTADCYNEELDNQKLKDSVFQILRNAQGLESVLKGYSSGDIEKIKKKDLDGYKTFCNAKEFSLEMSDLLQNEKYTYLLEVDCGVNGDNKVLIFVLDENARIVLRDKISDISKFMQIKLQDKNPIIFSINQNMVHRLIANFEHPIKNADDNNWIQNYDYEQEKIYAKENESKIQKKSDEEIRWAFMVNPLSDRVKNETVVFNAKVEQVISKDKVLVSFYPSTEQIIGQERRFLCVFNKDSKKSFYDGEIISLKVKVVGVYSYTNVLGATTTVPKLKVFE